MIEHSLQHPRGRTRILIDSGLLDHSDLAEALKPWLSGRTLFVLSTASLRRLHGQALDELTAAAGRRIDLEVPDGEVAKSLGHAGELWNAMLAAGGKRDSRLLTFGGGSVGDLGGFVAGCFLRGIAYTQVPTTLLAQVDAAVGGKTAVDLPGGKNSVGLFHHPDWVLSDTSLLATLPRGEIRSGLVEAVKMAALLDPPLLDRIERDLPRLLAADGTALGPVVAAAAHAKAVVVESDPAEGDRRRILNFGHTLGHAIEGVLGYQTLRHGEAVAYGLLFALRLAENRGQAHGLADRLRALLRRFELPPLPRLEAAALVDFMGRDKKVMETGWVWVLPRSPGAGEMVSDIGRLEVERELESFLRDPWAGAGR